MDVTDSGDPTEVTCETDHRRESCVFTASESGAYRITVMESSMAVPADGTLPSAPTS